MHKAIREAVGLCKTLLRNGYDAYVINAPLQQHLLKKSQRPAVDIACEPDVPLLKLFPNAYTEPEKRILAKLEENGVLFRFYPVEIAGGAHPELSLLRVTPSMAQLMDPQTRLQLRLTGFGSPAPSGDAYDGFKDFKSGFICLAGLPDETLRHNYLLAIRALRFVANYDIPVEPNTWLAIVRASGRVLDYVALTDIMDEWRKVAAESLYRFVRLLYDAHILQGLIPEVAALSCIRQQRNEEGGEESVFEHTLACVKHYPEEGFHYDWLGTMAMLFHDVGKLYTGEFFDGQRTFYQHHRVGAKVTRKILRRLHFNTEDIDLLCHLVSNHMRFHFMLTDRGIRRFKSLDEYPRLIAMTRADLRARDGSYTSFNHNMKYLDRAETPEQMLEPLLNGNEIMTETRLAQGPRVGIIRGALLRAQIAGDVTDRQSAIDFVKAYAKKPVG
ncbi:MAG: HD domain-containing protein [Desulfovibrio sp.]|jgi:poly(A) polymerase|nr:HD domain-containing protein [Desulfovibrio sp.]